MKLVLIRHAKAFEANQDPQRNLTEEGKKEAQVIRKYLQRLNWHFKEILTSPVLRAYQTAEIINEVFQTIIIQKNELKPNQATENIDSILLNYHLNDSLIIVLHMPDIAEIASKILKIPINNLFFSTCSAMGINITNLNPLEGILIFHYQPIYLE
jgi:phosphohistidine phosphatase